MAATIHLPFSEYKKAEIDIITLVIGLSLFIAIYSYIIPDKKHKGGRTLKADVFQGNDTIPIQTNVYKIVRVHAGFGNQLFQYSYAYALHKETSYPVYIDIDYFKECQNSDCFNLSNKYTGKYPTRKFGLRYYNISLKRPTSEQIQNTNKMDEFINVIGHNITEFKVPINQYFYGYYENLSYYDFEKHRNALIKEFTLKIDMPEVHKKYLKMIQATNSISIHIRRTDRSGEFVYASLQYYIDAINYMKKTVKNPNFFVFTDDLEFSKKFLQMEGNFTFIEGTSTLNPIFDFELMKSCKHHIIANSTFSWWAAFLNAFKDKIVIAPKYWRKGVLSSYLVPKNYIVF